jgi:hypothetical protein
MSTLLKVGQTSVGQTPVGQTLVAEKSRHQYHSIDRNNLLLLNNLRTYYYAKMNKLFFVTFEMISYFRKTELKFVCFKKCIPN